MHTTNNRQYSWVGSREMCLDEISIKQYGEIVIGKYGGNIKCRSKKE